ncbi:MAG: hypothetical protein WBG71_06615 [Leeuwenhoekiella sp.]
MTTTEPKKEVKTLPKEITAFLLVGLFALLVTLICPFILPNRFFNDVVTIIHDPYGEIGWFGSYPFAISFYKYTGLGNLPMPLVGAFQMIVVLIFLFKLGIPSNFNRLTLKNILAYFTIVICAVFMCMPSKEFITFLPFAAISWLLIKNKYPYLKTIIIISLILGLTGIFFREYFLIVLAIAIGLSITNRLIPYKSATVNLVLSIVLMTGISGTYFVFNGKYITQDTREDLNESRKFSREADSRIVSPFSTNTYYGETLSIIYAYFSINIPINGLKFILKPQIIAFVFWQLFLFLMLLWCYNDILKNSSKDKLSDWPFHILFAYLVVQAAFEPDLGSAIRHKIGVLPLIYLSLYNDILQRKEKLNF